MSTLKGKVAIVTGAGSGMGEAIADLFAKKDAKVIVADLNKDAVDKVTARLIDEGADTLGVLANVAIKEDLDNLMVETIRKYGTVDILINNAGILDSFMTVGDLDIDLWQRVLDVNVKGPTMLSKLVINHWLENKKPGVIINTASVGGMFGARGGVSYVTSKHAIIGLTKNIASVYREDNIRAVAVAPGDIKTNIGNTLKNPNEKGLNALMQYVATGPTGEAADVANVIAFLASDEAKFINGTVITVDGGWTGA